MLLKHCSLEELKKQLSYCEQPAPDDPVLIKDIKLGRINHIKELIAEHEELDRQELLKNKH